MKLRPCASFNPIACTSVNNDGGHDRLRSARRLAQPELGGLLDAIGEIEASVGKHDHLGVRALRLQQVTAEIRRA